SQLEEWS
ncbi:hypothetical protein D039_2305B, partial [Vibrio parahaemolyticus EKP-028]